MKVYTYLLKSLKDNSYYVGISEDISERLKRHNLGRVSSTANKIPWSLVYKKEHKNYEEARKHEKWLKKKNLEYKNNIAQLAPPIKGRGKLE